MNRLMATLCLGVLSSAAGAQAILIEDVRIFNGVDPDLEPGHVLVVDGIIETVSRQPIEALGRMGDPSALPRLRDVYANSTGEHRMDAAISMARLGDRQAFDQLIAAYDGW